jgi:hypothetical protein
MKQRAVALLAILAMGLAACSSSASDGDGSTSKSADAVTETAESTADTPGDTTPAPATSTTLAPTTSTTLAPTTTTEALPVLGEFDQIKTVLEAKSLLQLTTEKPPTVEDQPLADGIETALGQLVAGSVTPDDFFAATLDLTPPGAVVLTYLTCNVETYYNPGCEATAADYAETFAECNAKSSASIVEFLVEGDRWAASTTCIWRPTPDEVAEIVAYATAELTRAAQEITGSGVEDQEIVLLAQERADFFGVNPEGPQDEPKSPERLALDQKIYDRSRGGSALCGLVRVDEPDYKQVFVDNKTFTEDLRLENPVRTLGVGAVVMNGAVEVHLCWFTA